jgi:phosphoglycolate phosphatase
MDVVLFDIDGTLIHSGGAGRDALDAALQGEFGYASTAAVEVHGHTDRGIVRDVFRHFGIEETESNWQRFRDAYLASLPSCLAARKGRVLPGVWDLLEHLLARPATAVGLLTGNVRAGAQLKLGHYGVSEPFRFGGFGDSHYDRDDVAREAWSEIRVHVGPAARPDRVWVIGDTPNDIRCARAIGARVVAVATGAYRVDQLAPHHPDLVLEDLAQAGALWDMLGGSA